MSTGLPVVNKNWLLDCYKARKRIALRNYLVGDSIAPVDDIDDDDEVLCSQSVVLPESARDSIKGNDSDNFGSNSKGFCVFFKKT